MKMKKVLIGSLVVCGVLAATFKLFHKTALTKPESRDVSDDAASYHAVDDYVQQQMKRLNIPGLSLAIVEGDEVVHMRGFGRAHPNGDAPAPQTPFLIGSLTKSFTALGVMQLVEVGDVDLDAPVQRYLPWFEVADPQASAQITVRHLLNQTSGLSTASGWIPLADFDDSPDAVERQARALSTFELSHPVGSAFEYSNANYNLLGLIIEAVSGQSYADYVQDHVFAPLDMDHSYTSQATAKENGLAMGHRYWFWLPVAEPDLPMPRGSLPSGQLISSAEDMAHYLIALLNDGRYEDAQILSSAGVAKLYQGVVEHVQMGVSMGEYGMGWYESDIDGNKVAWHTGTVPDFSSYMALLPEQKKGVVLLINADHFMMNPTLAEVGEGVATLLADGRPAPLQLGFIPWLMRSLLLTPLLQIIGVVTTFRRLSDWRQHPSHRPAGRRLWWRHIVLPLIPNLLVALTLIPLLGPMRGFWMLFTPDYAWIAMICGGFAGMWAFLRTGLMLRARA
jgi:CubicO group peptidase (beta-lactamase class C family)